MNSLIGLEMGVVEDENHVIRWDGTTHAIAAWNRDHTLATAIENSVVWYYQALARQVGREEMQYYVELANYGNEDISGEIDTFWLEGGLRISPEEQVLFLRRLYEGTLPFSTRSMDIVKGILLVEETETYRLSAKTGFGVRVEPQIGWWVGYLEVDDVYFFATNIEDEQPDANFEGARMEISRSILWELGLSDWGTQEVISGWQIGSLPNKKLFI